MDSLRVALFGWPFLFNLTLISEPSIARGGDGVKPTAPLVNNTSPKPLAAVLSPAKWQEVERGVDHALAWLSSQQASDGSFPTLPQAQPAVTSFSIMAFLS